MAAHRSSNEQSSSSKADDLKGWALFIVLLGSFLLLLQLFGTGWGKIDQLTKILALTGGGALFQILREKLQPWLVTRKTALLVSFTVLLLLNLPLYGISIRSDPPKAVIKLDSKESSSTVYWLNLRKHQYNVSRAPFGSETDYIPAWRVFLTFWGLFPTNVQLEATYIVRGPEEFELTVDPQENENGKMWEGHDGAAELPLTAGEHKLWIKANSKTGCKKIDVPMDPSPIEISVDDRC